MTEIATTIATSLSLRAVLTIGTANDPINLPRRALSQPQRQCCEVLRSLPRDINLLPNIIRRPKIHTNRIREGCSGNEINNEIGTEY